MSFLEKGPISFYDIQNTLGGSNPISIDEYYRGGEYTTNYNNNIINEKIIYSKPKFTTKSSLNGESISINNIQYTDYNYIIFKNNSLIPKLYYNLTFSENTLCDVLIVGGGGSGGIPYGGGGGAGGVIYLNNINVKNANISVGKGGDNIITSSGYYYGNKGCNSSFSYNNIYQENTIVTTNNLLVWYKFNGDGNDSSGNGKHLTKYGEISYHNDTTFGESVFFGSNAYLEYNNSDNFFNHNIFSVTTWFKFQTKVGYQSIASLRDADANTSGWTIYISNDSLTLQIGRGTGYGHWTMTPAVPISPNIWYHLVFTLNSSLQEIKKYINGVLQSTTTLTSYGLSDEPLRIGQGASEDDTPINNNLYYQSGGFIKDFRYYNKLLTDYEIYNLYKYDTLILLKPLYYDDIYNLQSLAEIKTNVNGWRLVRFLPDTSKTWYRIDDNLLGIEQYGDLYDLTKEWSIPFGYYQEICLSTASFSHFLHYNKLSISPTITIVDDTIINIDALTDIEQPMYPYTSDNSLYLVNLHPENDYSYLYFIYEDTNDNGYNQTEYYLDIPTGVLEFDILLVGGGASGNRSIGDGGAGGAVIYETNYVLSAGSYTIYVSGIGNTINSGEFNYYTGTIWDDEYTTQFSGIKNNSTDTFVLKAMGAKSIFNEGVGRDNSRIGNPSGGTRTENIGTVLNGDGTNLSKGGDGYVSSLGGRSGPGADGPQVNITGTNTYYAGGGGGGAYKHNSNYGTGGLGGNGGGGTGTHYGSGSPGALHFGAGGGGGGNNAGVHAWYGAKGGSGVVIIKFKKPSFASNVIQNPNNTSLEFLYQDNDNPKNLDLLQDNRGMCVFVRNSNIINPITIQLQKKAEQVTLEYGWRIVRFLPYSSSTNWYSYDDNAMGTNNEDGNIYDYTNEWTLPFGHFDEILFSTFDMSHWLRTKKSEISISGYTNTNRNVLSSSRNFTNHYVKWHNRIDNEEDPFISLYDHSDFSPETHMHCLYAENNSSDNKELLNNYLHGGVCVFVRDSSRIYDTNPITKYKTLTFIHDNSNNDQTEYTIDFDTEATCDILIIAGGGGGGSDNAGGGGAGGLIFLENVKLSGSVIVKVGKGGNGGVNEGRGVNGFNSSVYNFEALGGGGGSCGNGSNIGSNGGSGGGGAGESDPGNGGISLQINHLTIGYGNNGGNSGSGSDKGGGGGGGAGSVGKDAGYLATDNGYGGAGGDGLYIINNKIFKNHFNIIDTSIGHHINDNIYFAGGGGAGNTNGRDSIDLFDASGYKTNHGGLGGGGAGGLNNSSNSGIDGLPNTGSGGGGGYYNNTTQGNGGNGGSGIVLIRISNKVFNYIANGGGGGGTVIPRNTFHNNNDNNIVNSTTIERMYPPIRNLSSSSHTISGQEYGNGLYQTNQSSYYSSQWNGFSAFQESVVVGYHGAGGQYNTSGTYLKSNYLVSGYNGDWITINMPQKINLTKYAFTLRSGSFSGRVPKKYKIYGSNDGSNWDVLVHKDDSDANPVYTNSKFEESVITVNTYNHFAVVVNKLIGGGNVDSLNLNEWYIYGKEYYTTYSTYLPNTTITKNIIDKQLVVIPKNLIAYYKFEKNFEDSSGNDNHLIPSNSYTPTIINNNSYGYGLRMLNNINTNNTENVSLDNSNSISVRNGTLRMPTFNLVNKEYTISFYYKILNTLESNQSGIFILGESERVSSNGSIEMYNGFYNSLNELKIIYRNNTIADGGLIFNPIIDYWYNITVTLKSSELIVYIDNSPKFVISFSNGLPDDIYDCNYFGCFNNSEAVYTRDDYLIRDFKIYDRQLSLTEIANLYIDNNIIIPKSLSYDGEKLLEEEILIYNYEDKSIYEFMAEKITGVQGWHHVKHLNKDATEWYPENTEEGRSFFEVKDETFDSYGSFTKSFPDKFNELLFTRSDGNGNVDRYVQCLKTDLETIINYNDWVYNITSIKTLDGFFSSFRGYGRNATYLNRAPMIDSRDSNTNDYVVYEEHYQTSTRNESNPWHAPVANKQYDVFARETRYDDKSIYELMSENVTGVQGWYHVKHLNKDATQWYPENTEEGRTFFEVKDEVFDSYGSFTKPFPDDFDELLFTRSDGNGNVDRYIHCLKTDLENIINYNNWVYNITSIKTQDGFNSLFRGYGINSSYANRAPMLLSENSFDNQADYTVYEEHYQTSAKNESNPWIAPVANKQYDVFARKSGTTTSIISLSSYDIIYWIQNSSNTSYLASIKNWKLKASEPSGNNWFSNGLLNDVPSTSHLLFVVDGPSTQRQWLMILKSDIEGEHNWSSLSRTSDYGTYSSIGINTISGYQAPVITSTTNVQSSDAFIYREESDSTWHSIPPTDRKYYVFEENNQTSHIVKFTEETICDVLIVAGGGGGGGALAGGGGAGGVLYIKDAVLNGNYDIKVGKGGLGSVGHGVDAMNGDNSIITIDNIEYEAIGGGGGGSRNPNPYYGRYGLDGGSGGGGSHSNPSGHGRRGGYTTQKSINSVQFYGNNGGWGKDSGKYRGGGGGGSGTVGGDWKDNHPGYGGNGIDFSYIFGKNIGENGYIAAGGGGGGYMHDSADSQGIGGIGGGGDGGTDGLTKYFPQNGIDGMGGGGGGNYYGSAGGSGGSGTVIIKKKYIPDYKILTFTHDNSTNDYTEYLLNLNTDIECDILIVGGGGGGSQAHGGGGVLVL